MLNGSSQVVSSSFDSSSTMILTIELLLLQFPPATSQMKASVLTVNISVLDQSKTSKFVVGLKGIGSGMCAPLVLSRFAGSQVLWKSQWRN